MHAALIQNPNAPAPLEIISALTELTVQHIDFTGKTKNGRIVVHELVALDVQDFFTLAFEIGFPIHHIAPIHESPFDWKDELTIEFNNSSGFNYRTITHSDKLSKHAIGCAFDINPHQNIYVRYDAGKELFRLPDNAQYDTAAPGTLFAQHPLVILLKNRGWTWGGDWTPESGRVDYQHFEKVPAELARYVE